MVVGHHRTLASEMKRVGEFMFVMDLVRGAVGCRSTSMVGMDCYFAVSADGDVAAAYWS